MPRKKKEKLTELEAARRELARYTGLISRIHGHYGLEGTSDEERRCAVAAWIEGLVKRRESMGSCSTVVEGTPEVVDDIVEFDDFPSAGARPF